jgi:Fe-S-cluster containining protein
VNHKVENPTLGDSGARFTEMRVTLNTPEGPIRGSVQVDTGPIFLADLVSTAQELTNILVARANRREEKAGHPISCRAGCGACCRQMVSLSIPECFYLADYLDSFDSARRKEVQDRFDAAEAELTRRGITEFFDRADYDDEAALKLAVDYFYLGIPCPFLVEESCSIHEHRPVVCRDYNVSGGLV